MFLGLTAVSWKDELRSGKEDLIEPRIYQDIRNQADSLTGVLRHQCCEGLPAILEAASLLRSAKRVLITGMGASMFASIPLEYALCARGIDATVIEAAELLHYLHSAFRDALWIVVSRSGESIEIKRLLETAGNGQTIIGVTNEPKSTLAQQAQVALHIGSQPDEMVAIQTYTGTLLTLHVLFGLIDATPASIFSEVESMLPLFATQVKRDLEHQSEWDSFLVSSAPMALLARGPAMASAMEGALLFNEIAKFPAFAAPVASFRHGPIEVADANFRGIVVASAGRTRELNLAFGKELVRFGAAVRMVGPRCDLASSFTWHDTLQVSEELAPLFDIVPMQVAATRLAELKGIWPGSFRYTPQVAVDEARFITAPGGSNAPNTLATAQSAPQGASDSKAALVPRSETISTLDSL